MDTAGRHSPMTLLVRVRECHDRWYPARRKGETRDPHGTTVPHRQAQSLILNKYITKAITRQAQIIATIPCAVTRTRFPSKSNSNLGGRFRGDGITCPPSQPA